MKKERSDILSWVGFDLAFGKRLDRIMVKKNITNQQLADEIDMVPSTISKYRNGVSTPNAYTVYLISKVLKCPIEQLMEF